MCGAIRSVVYKCGGAIESMAIHVVPLEVWCMAAGCIGRWGLGGRVTGVEAGGGW